MTSISYFGLMTVATAGGFCDSSIFTDQINFCACIISNNTMWKLMMLLEVDNATSPDLS